GAHRRAAPDLVVHAARRLARDGPFAREAEVPAEDERHAMLRIALGALDLPRIALGEEGARALPDRLAAIAEDVLLELLAHRCGHRLDARVGLVGVVEALRARAEHGAALEHLDLHAHLEHVGGGR